MLIHVLLPSPVLLRHALLALAAGALALPAAQAQTDEARPAASAPADGAAAPASSPASAATGRERRAIQFTPENITAAFRYLDKNKDGRISREEAAAFRGVARYFDRADVNHDDSLSREEFVNAMNRAKSR